MLSVELKKFSIDFNVTHGRDAYVDSSFGHKFKCITSNQEKKIPAASNKNMIIIDVLV